MAGTFLEIIESLCEQAMSILFHDHNRFRKTFFNIVNPFALTISHLCWFVSGFLQKGFSDCLLVQQVIISLIFDLLLKHFLVLLQQISTCIEVGSNIVDEFVVPWSYDLVVHIEISVNLLLMRNMDFLFFVLDLPVNQKLSPSMPSEQFGLHLHSIVDISLFNEFFSFNSIPVERFCCTLSS